MRTEALILLTIGMTSSFQVNASIDNFEREQLLLESKQSASKEESRSLSSRVLRPASVNFGNLKG